MKNLLNKTFSVSLIALLFASLFFIAEGCKCGSCEKQDEIDIPIEVLNKSSDFIKQQTGKEFFQEYISFDFKSSKRIDDEYYMVYRFIMPDKNYVNEKIVFFADTTGKINRDKKIVGIPNCFEGECEFNVDKEKAKQIAADAGLEEGIKDWETEFVWSAEQNKYVWSVMSTFYEQGGGEGGGKSNGEEVVIDPATGDVITTNEWFIR